jgi:hypothetical protein
VNRSPLPAGSRSWHTGLGTGSIVIGKRALMNIVVPAFFFARSTNEPHNIYDNYSA